MATSAEQTYALAVAAAESTRQTAKSAAFTTWAYGTGAALTTYKAALITADVNFHNSCVTAANTAACAIDVTNFTPVGSQWAKINNN